MSPLAKLLKWGTFAYEAFLALPFIGGIFVVANGWTPLGVAFVLHLITLIFMMKERGPAAGNMIGIITSIVGFIPILGWIMHGISALILLIEGINVSGRTRHY